MVEAVSGFDWDQGNLVKCQKHGVTIAAIESLFARPIAILPDPAHSGLETRVKAIGRTEEGRFMLIVFTRRAVRGSVMIHPISARYMHRKEVAYYEKIIAGTE